MSIYLYIENTKKDIVEFALPELSLSSARARMNRKEFRIEVEAHEIQRILEWNYREWVYESRRDDEVCGSPQDELAEAGYPELYEVIMNQELLELVVGGYLFEKLVSKFSKPSELTKYWWDQVLSCSYSKGKVIINGVCYCTPMSFAGVLGAKS